MDNTVFLAKFWGSLFMILGGMTIANKFIDRVIDYTEDRTITIATGYITLLLGLATVVAHNVWIADWPLALTILGWMTLIKGIMKVGLPARINKDAQLFRGKHILWGSLIFLIGVFYFWIGYQLDL